MGLIRNLGRYAWRKYVIDGDSSSGFNMPDTVDIFPFVDSIDSAISNIGVGYSIDYALRAELYADLAWDADSLARVFGDPTTAYIGVYKKSGAVGAGSWTRIGGLPSGPTAADTTATLAGTSTVTFIAPATLAPLYRQSNNLLTGAAGSAGAYTATSQLTLAAIVSRQTFLFTPHVDSDAGPTLNVNSLGAVEIRDEAGVALDAGVMKGGSVYPLIFISPYYRLLTASSASLVQQIDELSSRIDNLTGGDAVSDVYDESTEIGVAATVIVEGDQPIASLAIQNLSESATIGISFGRSDPTIGEPGTISLPPLAMLDQKGIPQGSVRAIATEGSVPISVLVGNNSRVSPNSPKRATALLRAMDAARGSITPANYEAAIRTLYYELDRIGVLQPAAGFYVFAADSAGAALIDWTSQTVATPVNAPTFTAKLGYTFDGATTYIRSNRRVSQGEGVTSHRGAVAMWARYGGATQASKEAMGDGIFSISAYRSGTTWSVRASSSNADIASGFTTADGDAYGWREDDNSVFVSAMGGTPQRFERDGRETLLAADILFGVNNTSGDTPDAASYWAGTVKAAYFGPPMGMWQWAAVRTAVNAYLATVDAL